MNQKEKLVENTILALQGKLTENVTKEFIRSILNSAYAHDEDIDKIYELDKSGKYPPFKDILNVLKKVFAKNAVKDTRQITQPANYFIIYKLLDKGFDLNYIYELLVTNSKGEFIYKDAVDHDAAVITKLHISYDQYKNMDHTEFEQLYRNTLNSAKSKRINKSLEQLGATEDQIKKITKTISNDQYSIFNIAIKDGLNLNNILFLNEYINKSNKNTYYIEKFLANAFNIEVLKSVLPNIDKKVLTKNQGDEIIKGLQTNLTSEQVALYCNADYTPQKMRKIRLALLNGKTIDEIFPSKRAYNKKDVSEKPQPKLSKDRIEEISDFIVYNDIDMAEEVITNGAENIYDWIRACFDTQSEDYIKGVEQYSDLDLNDKTTMQALALRMIEEVTYKVTARDKDYEWTVADSKEVCGYNNFKKLNN